MRSESCPARSPVAKRPANQPHVPLAFSLGTSRIDVSISQFRTRPKSGREISMAETSVDDWTRFTVGKPSTKKNWVEPACRPLQAVLHVTHIHVALDVLRDGQISPQLIYDKSRLNTDRILVIWLSPNDWGNAGGFRYGNVAFELEWRELIQDKRFYWVGIMDYKPPACRILVTDQNHDGTLKQYYPKGGDGPWWYDDASDEHFWNGNYCLEFMFEAPLPLDSVHSLRFVTHHPNRCSIAPHSCPDRGHDSQRGGARLLAGACARRSLRPLLWLDDDDKPTRPLLSAWRELRHLLTPKITTVRGAVGATHPAATALATSIMEAISEWRKDDRRELVALFQSENDAVESSAQLVETALDLSSGTLPRTFDEDD